MGLGGPPTKGSWEVLQPSHVENSIRRMNGLIWPQLCLPLKIQNCFSSDRILAWGKLLFLEPIHWICAFMLVKIWHRKEFQQRLVG